MKEEATSRPTTQRVAEDPKEGMKDGSCGLPSKCVVS